MNTIMLIRSHIFENWNNIPNINHLLSVKNNHVYAFEHGVPESVSWVSYAIKDDRVVAFGSATYFKRQNYYVDEDDDMCTKQEQKERKLWIESLVSIEKGCGSVILKELEKCLSSIDVPHKIINIMSVEESIGFYEENGYIECYTGPRFSGTGNIRVAKAIGDCDISLAKYIDYDNFDISTMECDIAGFIALGRRKMLSKFIDIPKDIPRKNYEEYVRNHQFKECVTEDMKNNIFNYLDDFK